MQCKDCRHGKSYGPGSVNCTLYGMIIRAEHECTLERELPNYEDYCRAEIDDTEIQEDSRGIADQMPGVLPGSGE